MGILIPLIVSLAPEIGKWIFGEGSVAARAAAAIAQAAESVTGTKDEAAQKRAIEADPALATQLRVQLSQIAAQAEADARKEALGVLTEQIADVASARAQTIALAQARSGLAWGAPVVSAIVLATFGLVMALSFMCSLPAQSAQVGNLLLGALATMATSVVSYWVGSSAGSARKDEHIVRLSRAPQ